MSDEPASAVCCILPSHTPAPAAEDLRRGARAPPRAHAGALAARGACRRTMPRHASRRVMGNITLAREDARAVWIAPWLDGVRQDAAYRVRSLRRNPRFAAAVILVCALGIGATTAVFGLLDGLVFRPLPVQDPERLVYLKDPAFSYPIFSRGARQRTPASSPASSRWNARSVNVDWNSGIEQTEVLMATGDFYPTLGVDAVLGRTFTGERRSSRRRPGRFRRGRSATRAGSGASAAIAGVIGRTVRIERRPFTIVGVAPRGLLRRRAGPCAGNHDPAHDRPGCREPRPDVAVPGCTSWAGCATG